MSPNDPNEKLPVSDRAVRENRSEEQSTDENFTDVDPNERQLLPPTEDRLPEAEENFPGREERLPGHEQTDAT